MFCGGLFEGHVHRASEVNRRKHVRVVQCVNRSGVGERVNRREARHGERRKHSSCSLRTLRAGGHARAVGGARSSCAASDRARTLISHGPAQIREDR